MGRILLDFGNIKQLPETNSLNEKNKIQPQSFSLISPSPATWDTLGSPWPPLKTAIDNLSNGPQTVEMSYSFIIAGTEMDPGTSVSLDDKFGGPNHSQFVTEITDSLNEWKAVFETLFSRRNGYPHNLIINLTSLGNETGNSIASNVNQTPYTLPHADNLGHFRFGMHNIDGSSNVIAHAYSPETTPQSHVGGDCHFDSSDRWRLDTQILSGAISIKLVAVHELGHTFGLGHDTNLRSIMYASVSSTQNFYAKFPKGLVNGHAGGDSSGSGLSDISAVYEIYK